MSERTDVHNFNPADPYPDCQFCIYGGRFSSPRWMRKASHVVLALKQALKCGWPRNELRNVRVWQRDIVGLWREIPLRKHFKPGDPTSKLTDFYDDTHGGKP